MKDDITVRNFIPPQVFQRYIDLNRICTDRRKADLNLRDTNKIWQI